MESDSSEESGESSGENESSGEEDEELRLRGAKEEEEETEKPRMKQPDLPCNANIIICFLLSFIFIIILVYIYAVYYLITYKRQQDRLEKFNQYYPYARGSVEEDRGYEFKPLKLPSSVFSNQQNKLRTKKYRMIIGTTWTHYSHHVEEVLEEMHKQMDLSRQHNPILFLIENVEYNVNYENFKTVGKRVEEEDGNFMFLDVTQYRFKDHFRDNRDVDYEDSLLPDTTERQYTCDQIAILTHTLMHFDFDYFMFFDLKFDVCGGDSLGKITHGLSFFEYSKQIDFCALKFSKEVTGMVFSKNDLILLTKYLESNIDKYPIDRLIHEYVYDDKPGKYKYCRSLGGKHVYSFKENLFFNSKEVGYPQCHVSMAEVKFLHKDDYMYDRSCEIDNYDFSPCRGF